MSESVFKVCRSSVRSTVEVIAVMYKESRLPKLKCKVKSRGWFAHRGPTNASKEISEAWRFFFFHRPMAEETPKSHSALEGQCERASDILNSSYRRGGLKNQNSSRHLPSSFPAFLEVLVLSRHQSQTAACAILFSVKVFKSRRDRRRQPSHGQTEETLHFDTPCANPGGGERRCWQNHHRSVPPGRSRKKFDGSV